MIVISGEALVDLTGSRFDHVDAYVPKLGGGPYNIAIGLGRLGVPVAYLGRISGDFFGQQLRARLLASGVNPLYVREGPELTTLAFVHQEPDREAARSKPLTKWGPGTIVLRRSRLSVRVAGPRSWHPAVPG